MYDQSLSVKNFRKIYDIENRKGNNLDQRFFKNLGLLSDQLKQLGKELRGLKKLKIKGEIEDIEFQRRCDGINETRKQHKENKEKKLIEFLQSVSAEASEANFSLRFKKGREVRGKTTYTLEKDAASYFALKQLQMNLKKLYRLQPSNRYEIVCQLKAILQDKIPKTIYKLDFSEFFESIPRDHIIKKLNHDGLLDATSKKLINRLFAKFQSISGKPSGLPRGLGLSAYLVELFMRDFDDQVRCRDSVVFYGRYVDDIVIVVVAKEGLGHSSFENFIDSNLCKLGLSRNQNKSQSIMFAGKQQQNEVKLDYLGYSIKLRQGLVIDLTERKVEKYKRRMELAFSSYITASDRLNQRAGKLLLKRIKYLTSNTRLLNNKRNAMVGVFFGNSLINDKQSLVALDNYKNDYAGKLADQRLVDQIRALSFVEGFEKKTFHSFTLKAISEIVEVWKNAT